MAILAQDLNFLQFMSISRASRRTYDQGRSSYLAFCRQFRLIPFPASEDSLNLFITYLARSLSFATIRTYLAAVRYWNIREGFSADFSGMVQLHMTLQGIKRLKGASSRPNRLPITIDILKTLKNRLRTLAIPEEDKLMLWAAFTTAFFGFLRSAEFCCTSKTSYDASTCLLVRDISISENVLRIFIKVSKADPFRNGHTIRLVATNSSICPLRAMQKHLKNSRQGDKPVFSFKDGSFLTRQCVSKTVQQLLEGTFPDAKQYSSHSFRIGAATTAAAADVPDWLIKVLGRWSSNCYERYIRTPVSLIDRIPSLLSRTRLQKS